MRKAILLALVSFFFLIRLANAQTPINNCTTITSSGNYILTTNLNLTDPMAYGPCIDIQASNVNLDLGGHIIESHYGSYSYGIRIWGANNVKIYNGIIKYFQGGAGILAGAYIRDIEFRNLVLYANWAGIYIFASYVNITDCVFRDNDIGIEMLGWNDHYLIKNNWFNNVDKDIDITGGSSWLEDSQIISNTFGNVTIDKKACCVKKTVYVDGIPIETETCVMPCSGTYSGANIAFDCAPVSAIQGCKRNDFVGNLFYARSKDVHLAMSEYNRFIRNTFANSPPHPDTGLYLEGDTKHNWGCENQGKIFDSGINNTFLDTCPVDIGYNISRPCGPGWQCLDAKTLAYILDYQCTVGRTIDCSIACENGRCVEYGVSPVPPQAPEVPSGAITSVPFFNATALQETGWGWLIPFITPLAFSFYIILGISGFLASKIKHQAGLVFALSFVAGILLITVAGILPLWAGIVLIVIAAGIVAWFFSRLGEV